MVSINFATKIFKVAIKCSLLAANFRPDIFFNFEPCVHLLHYIFTLCMYFLFAWLPYCSPVKCFVHVVIGKKHITEVEGGRSHR